MEEYTRENSTEDWWGDPADVTGERNLWCWLGLHEAVCGGWTSSFRQYLWCRCGAVKSNTRWRWFRMDDLEPAQIRQVILRDNERRERAWQRYERDAERELARMIAMKERL